jgi:hypothetical protein
MRPALIPSIRFVAALAIFSVLPVAQSVSAVADSSARGKKEKTNAEDTPKRVVKVYLVDDLVLTPVDYPFQANLPTAGSFATSEATQRSSGLGGTGGGMGGMSGGMRMGVTTQRLYANLPPGRVRRLAQLVNLLETIVKGDWHEGADSADQCIAFGNNLIVRQTEDGQRQIAALLDGLRAGNTPQSVTVEATWIWLDAQKREAFRSTSEASRAREILRDSAAFTGQITCLDGQTVHFATGQRRVISSGAQPTVGMGASAYMPKTDVVNVGVVLQVTPSVSRERHTAYVDLHSVATQWGKPGEPLKVTSQSFAGSNDKESRGILLMDVATVDRVNLGTQELSTSASIPLSAPVLVGSVTFAEPGDQTVSAAPSKRPELGLVIEVRPANF